MNSPKFKVQRLANSKNVKNEENFIEHYLPFLAGRIYERVRIGSDFIKVMAEEGKELYEEDHELGTILYEIAMQRISHGAVPHPQYPTPTVERLPLNFMEYASDPDIDQPGLMGDEEFMFLINQLENMCQIAELQYHALAICFGLSEYLSPEGKPRKEYQLGSDKLDGKKLRTLANNCISKYASQSELFRHRMK